jgi:transcriptional regulator with XRE-family HTH domain
MGRPYIWIGGLRRARLACGLSVPALRARLHEAGIEVTNPTILNWEIGRTFPRPEVIPALAHALQLDPHEVVAFLEEAREFRATRRAV